MYSRISNALTASCQAPTSATNKTIAAAFRVTQRTIAVERQRHLVPSASTRPAFWDVEEEHAHRGTTIPWLVTIIVTTTVVFLDDTGECWAFDNPEVRAMPNVSYAARRRSAPARQIEETLGQRCEVALHLLDGQHVGVLRLHVAQVDGVTGLGAIEAGLLGDGDAEVVAKGVEHGGPHAAARRRPRHDDAVAAEEDEVAE